MKKHSQSLVIIAMLLLAHITFAQVPYAYVDKSYSDDVQTVLLSPNNEPLLGPVIKLGEQKKLSLAFDLLGNYSNALKYTIVHCNYKWEPSDLMPAEFINGFTEDDIRDTRLSLNTLTAYVHYTLDFPTEYLQPKLSGNYLLVVYDQELSAEHLLFTKRFYVIDPQVNLSITFPQNPRNLAYSGKKQQLDVSVNHRGAFTVNPQESVKLVIKQDGRWDNAVKGIAPNFVYTDKISFEYTEEMVFDGGNCYRQFDMKSFKYQSERIQQIFQEPEYFLVRLWPDEKRANKPFINEKDLRGRKLIKGRDDQDTDVEGDYAWVEFTLPYDAPLTHEDIHIIGALNNWNLDEKSKMTYNYGLKAYTCSMFLKQGYYNYAYGVLERGQTKADVTAIEGDFWETQHDYAVLIYYRRPGTVYDQLLAYQVVLSHN